MVFENFSTEWYRDPDKFYQDPEPKWGPKVYRKHTSQAPSYTLSAVSKLHHTLPTATETMEAIVKFTKAMSYISEEYGLIGGSAVFCYARDWGFPTRLNADINLIVQPDVDTGLYAKELSLILCSVEFSDLFAVKRIAGVDVPQVRVKRGKKEVLVDVEILDRHTYVERRADYDLTLPKNKPLWLIVGGVIYDPETHEPAEAPQQIRRKTVLLLNTPWMLRQKILMWNERGGLQRANDKVDIETLCDVMNRAKERLNIESKSDIRKLKVFLKEFNNDPMVLGSVINCPEVFGPWYKLNWFRWTLAGFLFFVVPLAFDYYTSKTG